MTLLGQCDPCRTRNALLQAMMILSEVQVERVDSIQHSYGIIIIHSTPMRQ